MIVTAGKTNVSVYYYIVQDASGTSPGEPVTGLLFSDIETGGSASYARQGAARVDLTLVTLASASAVHTDGGFILVDDTNMPGLYRCDYPDLAFATGVDQVFLQLVVASAKNAVVAPLLVDLTEAMRGTDGVDTATMRGTDGVDTATMRGTDSALLAANINLTGGAVDNVTLVATTTANTDMRGTDGVDTATMRGTNGVDTATMRGTDSAALASVATEARLAELDPANLPATTDATLVDTGTTLPAQITALNDISVADVLTTQMTQSYAADGVAPTLTQALFLIQQILGDFAISGTTLTVREIDGATTAAIFTLDSATVPTSLTRTT